MALERDCQSKSNLPSSMTTDSERKMKDFKRKKKNKKKKRSKTSRKISVERNEITEEPNKTTVTVALDGTFRVGATATTLSSSSSSSSWINVFDVASRLQPAEGLEGNDDDDVIVDAGLSQIAQLAADCQAQQQHDDEGTKLILQPQHDINDDDDGKEDSKESAVEDTAEASCNNKRKRLSSSSSSSENASSESTVEEENQMSFEGRIMVTHSHQPQEQIMVLVDPTRSNAVYSASKRTFSGSHVCIGRVLLDDTKTTIEWNSNASMNNDPVENNNQEDETKAGTFPFPVNANDHCESPLESYRDIVPLLETLSRGKNNNNNYNNNKKKSSSYRIYDPYFCNGAVKRNLSTLGFPNVYNVKEDCYQVWKTQVGYPPYDILVTNPPYSGNHIEMLLQHVMSPNYGPRPWCLLLPTFVIKKDYYQSLLTTTTTTSDGGAPRRRQRRQIRPFYLVPRKRYVYVPPKDYRTKRNSDCHKKSSSFISMWYIWGGTMETNEELIQHYLQQQRRNDDKTQQHCCDLVRSKSALRDLRRRTQSNNTSSSK